MFNILNLFNVHRCPKFWKVLHTNLKNGPASLQWQGLKNWETKKKKNVYHITFIINIHWQYIGFVTGIFGKNRKKKKCYYCCFCVDTTKADGLVLIRIVWQDKAVNNKKVLSYSYFITLFRVYPHKSDFVSDCYYGLVFCNINSCGVLPSEMDDYRIN